MRARIVVDIPDEFLEARCRELDEEYGIHCEQPATYFLERLRDVVDDELRLALFGWPVTISVWLDRG